VICEHAQVVAPPRQMTLRRPGLVRRWRDPVQEFLATESAGGVVLAVAALVAICWATVATHSYEAFWTHELALHLGGWTGHLTLQHVAQDGLMPVFFFVVGLEIKREITVGELAEIRVAVLPVIAALGGMVVPAALYLAVTHGDLGASGWGIPMATDIAFVAGALHLLGARVPSQLTVFMLAIAVVDDIGALIVIAVWYSSGVRVAWIAASIVCLGLTWLLLGRGVRSVPIYVVLGLASCLLMTASGVSPTIAAVAFGLLMPMSAWRHSPARESETQATTAVERLEYLVHPWSAFVVLPLFALACAGIPLTVHALHHAATSPIAWGVACGLIVGKPVGIVVATWGAVALGVGALPQGLRWVHLAGGAALAGIGFTVAIFIASLAFTDPVMKDSAEIGILGGSLIAAAVGVVLLLAVSRREQAT
jgi:NhaA family Na+:H+ antiporter